MSAVAGRRPSLAAEHDNRRSYGFALLSYAFTAVMLGATLPSPMYTLYSERLHFSVLTTTIILATYAGGVLVTLVVFGSWSDALGRRPMLLVGVVAALASAVVFLMADSVPLLLVGRALSGLSAGIFSGTGTAAVIEAAPPSWHTRAAAVATVANVGGLGLGCLLAGLLVQYAPDPLKLAFAVHIVLAMLAFAAVLMVSETSRRVGRIGVQRLSVPPEVRSVFGTAATAVFAGFAVMGLFGAVAPSFVAVVIGIPSHVVAGIISSLPFLTSAVAQTLSGRIPPPRAMTLGCVAMVIGMAILTVAMHVSSLSMLVAAAAIAGTGLGISFSSGLAAVIERTPADRRAEVSSTYFVVAYLGLSLPVVCDGFAVRAWGLPTASVTFAIAIALLAALCLVAVLVQESRARRVSRPEEKSSADRRLAR
jgi:MFS family permease